MSGGSVSDGNIYTRGKGKIYTNTKGLFSVLDNRFKPCHNNIILVLQYQKLCGKSKQSAQEWMARL